MKNVYVLFEDWGYGDMDLMGVYESESLALIGAKELSDPVIREIEFITLESLEDSQ